MDKAYKTECGYPVKIYEIHKNRIKNSVHGSYFDGVDWCSVSWMLNGVYTGGFNRDLDLVEIVPRIKRTYWLNLYPNNRAGFYYSRESADAFRLDGCLACQEIHIDCEEGEGL